jgi:serine/threonine-protein kinase
MTASTCIDDVSAPLGSALPAAAPVPSLPDQYQLRAHLGEGGYGDVYEAWDSKLCRSVAVKCFKHAGSGMPNAGLMREARLAASLHHAAFVKVHAVEDDGSSQFIVMEMVQGSTLKQTQAGRALDPATALDWIGQVAEAMRDAHASGLVHGDLKPSNLMVEPGGKVRILDFGLAMRYDMMATTSMAQAEPQGTIAYMAPERLLGAAPDARGDVYALGVILYELVSGTRPFATLNGLALAAAHVQSSSDSWNYPESLEQPLVALIRAMTARDPNLRLPGMAQVLQRLTQLGTTAQASTPVVEPAVEPTRPTARMRPPSRRALRIGAGVLAVAIAAIGTWQAAPYIGALTTTASPYSEALEMEQGLAALKLFDRPGSLDAASAHFSRILDRSPDHAGAAAGISLVYSLRYMSDHQDEVWLQKADASAQQALKLDKQLALSRIALGWVLAAKGRFDEALQEHERALRLDPANFFGWHGKAEVLRHARRYPEALAALEQAMRRFPQERVFTDELGSVYYEQGDYAAAERAFRRSIALQPDAVVAYANLNGALLRQDRGDEALRVLQQGLQVRPSANLYTNLGNALFLRADYVGAAEAFENAVSPTRGMPGDYLNWANLGDTLLWIPGREKQAREAYDKARRLLAPLLQRAPNEVVLVSRMGLYAARTGDAAQAMDLMARAVALAPKGADVQFRAGLAYELLGKRALALDAIAKARRLGYPAEFIDAEPDLVALRRDPAYHPD